MITPLELAELLEEGPRRAGDAFIASELRRLAQVEAEHAALLKAISDAEPVAWINEEQTIGPNFLKRHLSFGKYFSDNPLHYKHIPLYTLNGIKKP